MYTIQFVSLILLLVVNSAIGQTVYKCPKLDGTTMIQQMPCSAQGGGEIMTVVPLKSSGDGLRESELVYLKERDAYRIEEAKQHSEEEKRQEVLRIEKAKAKAAENQARATWYLGSAILLRR